MIKKESVCLICNNKFSHYGEKILCNEKCISTYIEQLKEIKPFNIKCIQCNEFMFRDESKFCSRICWYKHKNELSNIVGEADEIASSFWGLLSDALYSGSKIVKKDWGVEIWFVNHDKYCLKYLVFYKGFSFSFHMHLKKQKLWYCLQGKFETLLETDTETEYFTFNQGDKIELLPGVKHQLRAVENSIIIEVSTTHYDDDSIRNNKIPNI